jgi:S1-C subfamily serine protease
MIFWASDTVQECFDEFSRFAHRGEFLRASGNCSSAGEQASGKQTSSRAECAQDGCSEATQHLFRRDFAALWTGGGADLRARHVPAEDSDKSSGLLTAQSNSGSGTIMSPDRYILTNAHVVKGAHSLKVQLNVRTAAEAREQGDRAASRALAARLVGVDRESDLALIKIDQRDLPYVVFALIRWNQVRWFTFRRMHP